MWPDTRGEPFKSADGDGVVEDIAPVPDQDPPFSHQTFGPSGSVDWCSVFTVLAVLIQLPVNGKEGGVS